MTASPSSKSSSRSRSSLVALLGAAMLFSNAIVVSGNTRNRVVAANLATQAMENVRGLAADPTKFVVDPAGSDRLHRSADGQRHPVHDHPERAVRRAELVDELVRQPAASTTGQIMQVSESVTWPSMGGTQAGDEVTTLSPPVGAYSASTGSIAAKVTDSTGARRRRTSTCRSPGRRR